jgi:hypothetical protein
MQAIVKPQLPAIGAALEGGFFAGAFILNGEEFGLIVAPKAEGHRADVEWNGSYENVEGALSYDDGAANTEAMLAAGSDLAKWVRELQIGGFNDWYLPSQDELELCYRHMKPGTDENSCYGRSGINMSASPQTRPYTPTFPVQTEAEQFRGEGAEAFDERAYWSSTQYAGDGSYAWAQHFDNGTQDWYFKGHDFRARAVRKIKL